MARNNISLSYDDLGDGRFKVRWREWVEVEGKRVRKDRSQIVTGKGARDTLIAKIRRTLEEGEVYEPEARKEEAAASLEVAALAWLRWQRSRSRAGGTIANYKSKLARIMATIRTVRSIAPDEPIPVTVLSIQLFSDLLNHWMSEDLSESGRAASEGVRYHLAGHLLQVWRFAVSQPSEYPGVPAPPEDPSLVVPLAPVKVPPPEAPSWEECDRMIQRAYRQSRELGDLLAGERLTGLRVEQVAGIRRGDLDTAHALLTVRNGKSRQEKAQQRVIPVPASLLEVWLDRIEAHPEPDAYLFDFSRHDRGTTKHLAHLARQVWEEATAAGEVRRHVWAPPTRRRAKPNHAFRAAYMAGLEAVTVSVNGLDVRVVDDKTIAALVGHSNFTSTKDTYYSPTRRKALEAAVGMVPPIGGPYPGEGDSPATGAPEASGGRVIAFPRRG